MCSRQMYWVGASIAVFIITILFNYLSIASAWGTPNQQELSAKYSLPITPPGWVFSVWGLIYIWQSAWQILLLVDTIRFRDVLTSNDILTFSPGFYIAWILSGVFNICWILLFSFEQITASTFALIAIQWALYVAGYLNTKYLGDLDHTLLSPQGKANDQTYLTSSGFPSYLITGKCLRILYRILVNNGIAFYGGWCTVAACLNIGLFLAYPLSVDKYASSWVVLILLAIFLVVYLVLDFYVYRIWLMYTYSPYIILIWALAGVSTNAGLNELEGMVVGLLVVVIVALVVKVVSGMYYELKEKQQQEVNDSAYTNMGV